MRESGVRKLLYSVADRFVEAFESKDWSNAGIFATILAINRSLLMAYPSVVESVGEDLTVALLAPVIYHPGGWTIESKNFRLYVLYQRLKMVLNGDYTEASDADVMAYLYAYHLTNPGFDDTQRLYLCLSRRFVEYFGGSVPEDIGAVKCGQSEKLLLRRLKRKIFDSQVKIVREMLKDNREPRGESSARQTSLTEFIDVISK